MRNARAVVAAVLGGVVTAAGCCKTCGWCKPGDGSTPTETRRVAPPTEKTAPLTGSTLPARTTAPAPTGGGPGY